MRSRGEYEKVNGLRLSHRGMNMTYVLTFPRGSFASRQGGFNELLLEFADSGEVHELICALKGFEANILKNAGEWKEAEACIATSQA